MRMIGSVCLAKVLMLLEKQSNKQTLFLKSPLLLMASAVFGIMVEVVRENLTKHVNCSLMPTLRHKTNGGMVTLGRKLLFWMI